MGEGEIRLIAAIDGIEEYLALFSGCHDFTLVGCSGLPIYLNRVVGEHRCGVKRGFVSMVDIGLIIKDGDCTTEVCKYDLVFGEWVVVIVEDVVPFNKGGPMVVLC